ncbi:hypothetical protein ACHAWF_012928, partial [Thalassiosira exigua]
MKQKAIEDRMTKEWEEANERRRSEEDRKKRRREPWKRKPKRREAFDEAGGEDAMAADMSVHELSTTSFLGEMQSMYDAGVGSSLSSMIDQAESFVLDSMSFSTEETDEDVGDELSEIATERAEAKARSAAGGVPDGSNNDLPLTEVFRALGLPATIEVRDDPSVASFEEKGPATSTDDGRGDDDVPLGEGGASSFFSVACCAEFVADPYGELKRWMTPEVAPEASPEAAGKREAPDLLEVSKAWKALKARTATKAPAASGPEDAANAEAAEGALAGSSPGSYGGEAPAANAATATAPAKNG